MPRSVTYGYRTCLPNVAAEFPSMGSRAPAAPARASIGSTVVTRPCYRNHDTARGPAGRARSRPGRRPASPAGAPPQPTRLRADDVQPLPGHSQCRWWPAGVSVPSQVHGIVLRRPDGIKGADGADGVADAMAQAPPLTPPSRRRGLPGVKEQERAGRAPKT